MYARTLLRQKNDKTKRRERERLKEERAFWRCVWPPCLDCFFSTFSPLKIKTLLTLLLLSRADTVQFSSERERESIRETGRRCFEEEERFHHTRGIKKWKTRTRG